MIASNKGSRTLAGHPPLYQRQGGRVLDVLQGEARFHVDRNRIIGFLAAEPLLQHLSRHFAS
jgi:hypothetical protein